MSEDDKALAFGKFLMGAMEELRRMEFSMPTGFVPEEMTHVVQTADGNTWKISVSRAGEDDE